MTSREQRISNELERCRESIKKTKSLIEYHRDMLKRQESRENALTAKLEKMKMSSLCEVINKGGYDIDLLKNAVITGDFSGIVPTRQQDTPPKEKPAEKPSAKTVEKEETTTAEEKEDISESESEE